MNHSLPNLFLPIATSLGYWLITRGLSGARVALKWAAGKAWPLALFLILSVNHASAGWFTRGPDPKTEAANRTLERAAQIATEAASTQVNQHIKLLEAVEALSSERTHLAKHLEHLGTLASRDSAWAAAIHAAAPLLVAVAVLALGCAAIWLVTRSGSQDAELAAVLVDEITGTGAGILVPEASQHQTRYGFPAGIEATSPDHTHQTLHPDTQLDNQEGELPF